MAEWGGTFGFMALGIPALTQRGFESRLSPELQRVVAFSHYDVSVYSEQGCFLEPEFTYKDFKPAYAGMLTGQCHGDYSSTPVVPGSAPAKPFKRMVWDNSYAAALTVGLRHHSPPSQLFMQYTSSARPTLTLTAAAPALPGHQRLHAGRDRAPAARRDRAGRRMAHLPPASERAP